LQTPSFSSSVLWFSGSKALDRRKKKLDAGILKSHVNDITIDDPIYLFFAMDTPVLFQL